MGCSQSHFHAFQARVDKRFAHGFQMLGNFQWSKLLEKRSRLNDGDPVLEKRAAADDSNRRTFPSRFGSLRQDGVNRLDFSFIKGIPITEKLELTYRCEFFNSTNRPIFSVPNTTPTSGSFGIITNQANQPRRIQMALRLVF